MVVVQRKIKRPRVSQPAGVLNSVFLMVVNGQASSLTLQPQAAAIFFSWAARRDTLREPVFL
jgi:hypothetical protein